MWVEFFFGVRGERARYRYLIRRFSVRSWVGLGEGDRDGSELVDESVRLLVMISICVVQNLRIVYKPSAKNISGIGKL